jgi:hypothetical protein
MKNKNHWLILAGLVFLAFVLWEISRAFAAGERTLAGIARAPFDALASAGAAIAALFTGGGSDDPNAPDPDLAAAKITNLDGTPISGTDAALQAIGIDPHNNALNNPANAGGYFKF